jgi:hypothetical protein
LSAQKDYLARLAKFLSAEARFVALVKSLSFAFGPMALVSP